MWILENCRNLKNFIYALLDIFRALAKNCNETISEKGAEAKDWRGGKPLRVVRNCKGRKHSDYAPEEGNRYDGIYKVSGQFCFIRTHTGNLTYYWIVSLRSVWKWKGILEIFIMLFPGRHTCTCIYPPFRRDVYVAIFYDVKRLFISFEAINCDQKFIMLMYLPNRKK